MPVFLSDAVVSVAECCHLLSFLSPKGRFVLSDVEILPNSFEQQKHKDKHSVGNVFVSFAMLGISTKVQISIDFLVKFRVSAWSTL